MAVLYIHCKVSLQKALAHRNGIPGGISSEYNSVKRGRGRAIQNASKAVAQVGSHAQLLTHSTLAEGAQLPSDPLFLAGVDVCSPSGRFFGPEKRTRIVDDCRGLSLAGKRVARS